MIDKNQDKIKPS